ncbi:MAG: hypothetical protein NWE94_08830 [Candidatus Bathyarchaeota archaeon]|nr:hypothetical protein [Candidatus Bathyarchaeota archaeon]
MSLPIGEIVKLIPAAIQVCKDLKTLFNESRKEVESQKAGDRWATYINPIHGFKVSWPAQRWGIMEIGNIAPYTYIPITLSFKMTRSVRVPSTVNIGKSDEIVPNVNLTIDLHGGIDMHQYVKIGLEGLSAMYKSVGAEFYEERLGRKVEADGALVAGHVKFSNVLLWQIQKIKRFEDKMYTVTGTIIEGVPNVEIALNDLPKIMNSVTILG